MLSVIACIRCRERKVKCDNQRPCFRCLKDNQTCLYVKSRRGGKRKNYADKPLENTKSKLTVSDTSIKTELDEDSVALAMYFEKFHESHPFLPSYLYFTTTLNHSPCPEVILPVLSIGYSLLGSAYSQRSQDRARNADEVILRRKLDTEKSIAHVQLLLGQSLHKFAHNDRSMSSNLLSQACAIAMSPDLMCPASDDDYELIGSFQRTMQELWMCDVMFAALMAKPAGFLYTNFTPQAVNAKFAPVSTVF